MPRQCEFCGKRVKIGYQYTYRGLAKSKGGVGRKVTGKTKRKFEPNLQRVRALVGTSVRRVRVCTRCLRSGVIRKPGRRPRAETAVRVEPAAPAAPSPTVERAPESPTPAQEAPRETPET